MIYSKRISKTFMIPVPSSSCYSFLVSFLPVKPFELKAYRILAPDRERSDILLKVQKELSIDYNIKFKKRKTNFFSLGRWWLLSCYYHILPQQTVEIYVHLFVVFI